MRFVYDCEFVEDGRTIDLVSIGVVSEDGREYYAVVCDAPLWRRVTRRAWWHRIRRSPWLMEHVWPSLPLYHGDARREYGAKLDWRSPDMRTRAQIRTDLLEFLGVEPELWADTGAYDHVVLAQLWGAMPQHPAGWPYFTRDIRQEAARLGDPPLPTVSAGAHNAIVDARHGWACLAHLDALVAAGRGPAPSFSPRLTA